MSDPHAAIDPDRRAGPDDQIDTGIAAAGRGSVGDHAGAALNSENLNLVVSPEVAETYAAHWRQRLNASVPFTGRDEWCRRRAPGGGA